MHFFPPYAVLSFLTRLWTAVFSTRQRSANYTLLISQMVEKTDAVDVSGTSEFDSTVRFRVKNNLIRHPLRHGLALYTPDQAVESASFSLEKSTHYPHGLPSRSKG